ncbi:hypothetical protein F5Y16DRAFT_419995 [Xylariaceae sp. FL0255]|nr:hypothetical protein F5Y16DRAFT_419995 [Xylariaceae sp. FL0255]
MAGPTRFAITLNVTNWVLTTLTAAFLGLRVYCKISRHRVLWWDDYILIIAFFANVAGCALLSYSISLGFADPHAVIGEWAASQLNITGVVQAILFAISSDLSKTSFSITLLRFTEGRIRQVVIGLAVLLNIVYFFTTLAIFFKCVPFTIFPADKCWTTWQFLQFSIFGAVFSAVFDFTLALVPWFLVRHLNMKRTEKLGVAIAMSFGSLAGITAIVRGAYLPLLNTPNFSSSGTTLAIWYVAEACATIIAASIPVLRVLLKDINLSSAGRYFGGSKKYAKSRDMESGSKTKSSALHSSRVVTTVTGKKPKEADMYGDTSSDKSILEPSERGKIVQTQEIRLSYHDRSDVDSVGYEMEPIARR